MATPDTDEMERLQRLSDNYQPNLSGPKVGVKRPISELSTEYAQADQAFVIKTRALERSHIAYRQIQGDGQCGWRAVVFAYFEILLKSGDIGLINQEKVRLQSFEQMMRAVGIDYDIIVDMFDYTWDLFDTILAVIQRGGQNESPLLDTINDENQSNSIIYHFKMMTSSFMQVQSDRYENFLEMSVQQYCLTRIDPANQEIDHIGLQALTDALISPAYIAVEVSYLDRSDGDEVTPHPFVPDASPTWPTIRLIYRPGHYDLIYKDDPIQVYLQTQVPQYIPQQRNDVFRGDMDALNLSAFLFPGSNVISPHADPSTSYTTPSSNFAPQYTVAPPMALSMADSGQPSYFPTISFDDVGLDQSTRPRSLPYRSHSDSFLQQSQHQPQPQPYPYHFSSSPQSPQPPSPPEHHTSGTSTMKRAGEPQVRYHEYCYNYTLERHESLPLDPVAFGSSTQNLNHFTNSEFQPQMWNAKDEYSKMD